MNLIRLIQRHAPTKLGRMFALLLVATAAQLVIAVIVTDATYETTTPEEQRYDVVLLLLDLAVFFVSQRVWIKRVSEHLGAAVESACAAAFARPQRHETAAFHQILADVATLSSFAPLALQALHANGIVLLGLAFVAYHSLTAAALVAGVLVASGVLGVIGFVRFPLVRDRIAAAERAFSHCLARMTGARRSFLLYPERRHAFQQEARGVLGALRDQRLWESTTFSQDLLVSQNIFFLLLASLVFLVPALDDSFGPIAVTSAAIVLFLYGPMTDGLFSAPIIAEVDAAAHRLLAAAPPEEPTAEATPPDAGEPSAEGAGKPSAFADPRCVTLDNGTTAFGEPPEPAEAFGPWSLTVERGSLTVVEGPAGSGKSLLCDLMVGLRPPKAGLYWVDRHRVEARDIEKARALWALVCEDDPRPIPATFPQFPERGAAVADLLDLSARERLALCEPIALSSGERKRIALAAAIGSQRPFLALDGTLDGLDPAALARMRDRVLPALLERDLGVILFTTDARVFPEAHRLVSLPSQSTVRST